MEELHEFAARLGLQRRWFQDKGRYPHYDVTLTGALQWPGTLWQAVY